MKNYYILGLMAACLMIAGCNSTGTPVEYANTCDKANDDKRVEIVGFLDNKGGAMCSSGYGHPMRCPISFKADLASEKGINADIDKGTGSSSIDEYEKGKGLKIKDDKGEFIERTEKVKIVADVNVFDTPEPATAGCYLVVKKIEKAL